MLDPHSVWFYPWAGIDSEDKGMVELVSARPSNLGWFWGNRQEDKTRMTKEKDVQDRTPLHLVSPPCVSYPAALLLKLSLVNDVCVWCLVVRVVCTH